MELFAKQIVPWSPRQNVKIVLEVFVIFHSTHGFQRKLPKLVEINNIKTFSTMDQSVITIRMDKNLRKTMYAGSCFSDGHSQSQRCPQNLSQLDYAEQEYNYLCSIA